MWSLAARCQLRRNIKLEQPEQQKQTQSICRLTLGLQPLSLASGLRLGLHWFRMESVSARDCVSDLFVQTVCLWLCLSFVAGDWELFLVEGYDCQVRVYGTHLSYVAFWEEPGKISGNQGWNYTLYLSHTLTEDPSNFPSSNFVCLSSCLSLCLPVSLTVCLSVCVSPCLSSCLST